MKYDTILLDFDDTIVDFLMQKIEHFIKWHIISVIIQLKKIFNILRK